ncbi:protein NLRC5-like isoform X6 [Labeo rohita]|uniref:protein NLRC5-like isoform X6 n=1 Tax=Labeo rohita TaxID=84645 RepID=UPI0021E2CB35|nr:protein NLRC5-like isoform X6 [Labeo rohita]
MIWIEIYNVSWAPPCLFALPFRESCQTDLQHINSLFFRNTCNNTQSSPGHNEQLTVCKNTLFSCSMSEERGKDSLSEMSLSEKQSSVSVKSDQSKGPMPNFCEKKTSSTKSVRSGSPVSSSVSVKSDMSKEEQQNFSDKTTPSARRSGSPVSSSVSVKSDMSKEEPTNFSNKKTPSARRAQYETFDSDYQTHRNHKNFKDYLLGIFQDLESKVIQFLKNELEKFRKILQKDNLQYFVNDFNDNRCSIKEAALDLALYFLREMKQDEAADTLEDDLNFIHQLKCSLKKKYQCVFEGIAKQGDSTLLNNIYTDLYVIQGCSEQVNTEHEVRQIEVASRRCESQEIQVECKQLFKAPEQDKEIRTVLTKGVAGIGKSVSVQKLILDWAEGKENQDISFIFPLPFREMNLKEEKKISLIDLVTQFFPETKGLNLTRRKNFKVLFILDGLDECRLPLNFEGNEMWTDVSSMASLDVLLTNLIKGNLLPSALIWITTRPAAASKIPPDCVNRLTEIRGFNDAQKEEYFKKRFTDENQAKDIIDHVKKSKSLFIMCHIPVFCWISATVFQNILEEKINNDLKKNEAHDSSKTLQESNNEDTPKTLTQMYTHFLHFQIQQIRRKYGGEFRPDVSRDKDTIISLGKLAFQELEKNNLIFYDTDLEACGIDVCTASVYSGMCTQIFKEETGIIIGSMYCFVHLSIQEFIAALYAHLFLDKNKKSVFSQDSTEQENKNENMIDLLKTAVDKALESDNGHLDLFLRFLLGLSLQSNRRLLRGLLTQQDCNDRNNKEVVQYIKQKLGENLSPERSINLFYCLNELNDQTLVKEIQNHLSKGSLSSGDLSPTQWSALAFVLLTSGEELEDFELQKFKKSDECLIRLSAIIRTSKRALLNDCNLTDKSCPALATLLGSDSSLKELNMNNNNMQDSGVKKICTGLKSKKCELETLRLSNCGITKEGYKALASALRSNPSHLIELDLTGNDPGQSGMKQLTDVLQTGCCKLKILSLNDCSLTDKSCSALATLLGSDTSLKELNMNNNNLQDSGVKQICTGLKNMKCKLEILRLSKCALTEKSCPDLASVLSSDSSSLKDLDLSNNNLHTSGVKLLSDALKENCMLEKLRFSNCSITKEGYKALASALGSNSSHLIELDLTGNDPGHSGVKELNDLLQDGQCKLKTIRFLKCPGAQEVCEYLTEVLGKSPLLLKELKLSGDILGALDGEKLSALLMDSHSKVEKINVNNCELTEKSCLVLATVLSSKTILQEVNLNNSRLLDSGVNEICEGLKNPVCELKILKLSNCSITEEGYKALASALRSNPLHLIELDLTGNDPGQSGVRELNDLLQDPNCQLNTLRFLGPAADKACQYVTGIVGINPLLLRRLNLHKRKLGDKRVNQVAALLQDKHCKLDTLMLNNNRITAEGFAVLISALNSNPSNLTELDLSGNKIGNSGICLLLNNPQCRLEKLRLSDCSVTEEGYKALASALRSNPSHLIELDLSGNDPGESGVKELIDVQLDRHSTLKTIRFLKSPAAEKVFEYLTEVLGQSPLLLKELDLSENILKNLNWEKLSALLMDSHSKVEKIILNNCKLTEKSCSVLAAVLSSKTILKEVDLNNSRLLDSGVKEICVGLKNPMCELKILKLSNCSITEEGYKALASALKSNPSHLIELHLTGNDPGQSGVKELDDLLQDPNCQLKILRLLPNPTAVEACQYVTGVVGKNLLLLRELNLSDHKLGDTRVNQIAALLQDKHCKLNTLTLCDCGITEKSCSTLAAVLRSNPSLKELDISNNNLQDSGVKKLQNGLENTNCTLKKLKLSKCSITEEGYKALASALRSNPSHLIELDLTGNDPGQSGVKELDDLLQNPNCQLNTLRFLDPAAYEACQYVTEIVGENPLLLRELNLSEHELEDTQVNQIAALLQDKHCKLKKLKLNNNRITEKGCAALTSAFNSNPSNLIELDLSGNKLGNSGTQKIFPLLKNPQCKLKTLKLSNCSITKEGYKALALALRSNPSHLIELDLTGNDPGQSGVKELSDLLQEGCCKLTTIRFLKSPAAEEVCEYFTEVLGESPLLLKELDLSEHKLGDLDWEKLSALLTDSHSKVEKIMLNNCELMEKSCSVLGTVLSSKTILKEINLNNSRLLDSGVKEICEGLKNPVCELKILKLSNCSITEEGYKALASALRSNPSHLIELDLTGNDPGQAGVKQLYDLLQDPYCRLKLRFLKSPTADEACQYVNEVVGKNPLLLRKLNLCDRELGDTRVKQIAALLQDKHCTLNTLTLCGCSITEKQCHVLSSALKLNPSHLRELNLSRNKIKSTGVRHICNLLNDFHCKLERLRFEHCYLTDEDCSALALALKPNPSLLRELALRGNKLGQLGVTNLSDVLMNPQCKLEKLDLCGCRITEKQCVILTPSLCLNLSHLRELDLSQNKIENKGLEILCGILNNPRCKLKRLSLNDCGITDVAHLTQSLANTKALEFLKELDLSKNNIGYSKKQLIDMLRDSSCNLCMENEHWFSWSTGANIISSIGGWLTRSKAQEKPVKSTEQEESQSDEEFSEDSCYSTVINAAQEEPVESTEQEESPSDDESLEGSCYSTNINAAQEEPVESTEQEESPSDEESSEGSHYSTLINAAQEKPVKSTEQEESPTDDESLEGSCYSTNINAAQEDPVESTLQEESPSDEESSEGSHYSTLINAAQEEPVESTEQVESLSDEESSEGSCYSTNINAAQEEPVESTLQEESPSDEESSEGSCYSTLINAAQEEPVESTLQEESPSDEESSEGSCYSTLINAAQEEPVESTEQEESLSDEESSEGSHYSTLINAAQEKPVKSTEQEESPTDEESSEGSHYRTLINAAQEEPVESTEQEESPSDEESSEGETEKGDEANDCSNKVDWLDINP